MGQDLSAGADSCRSSPFPLPLWVPSNYWTFCSQGHGIAWYNNHTDHRDCSKGGEGGKISLPTSSINKTALRKVILPFLSCNPVTHMIITPYSSCDPGNQLSWGWKGELWRKINSYLYFIYIPVWACFLWTVWEKMAVGEPLHEVFTLSVYFCVHVNCNKTILDSCIMADNGAQVGVDKLLYKYVIASFSVVHHTWLKEQAQWE